MASLKNKHFMIGLSLTFIVASFSFLAAKLPISDKVGALTIAILIAILYRHFKGYPEQYSSRYYIFIQIFIKICNHPIWT